MCFGGSSAVPSIPLDPNLQGVQNSAYSGTQSLGQYTPQTQGIYYNQANNPYAAAAQAGAGQAGALGVQQGQQNIASAGQFAGVPSQLSPAIAQTLQTAYDPQQALYNQYSQQSQDQTNAGLAQRGLQYSPYGAGVAATAGQQFDTNWLQTQLGREQTGANTIASLLGAGTGAAQAGAQLGNAGVQQVQSGTALPYTVATGMNQDLAQTVPFLTSNQQQQLQDYMSYYGAANTNSANAVNAGAAIDKSNQALGQGIGSLLGNLFGGGGGQAGAGTQLAKYMFT